MHSKEFLRYATQHHGIPADHLTRHAHTVHNGTRSVIEERAQPFREIDVFSRLIMDRIIFLGTPIDDQIANIIIAQLLFLESVAPEQEITLYINSPGGKVYPGLGIYDTMQYIKPAIATICTGLAASMAAVLLAGGTHAKRASLPHARIMIHQPLGSMQGQAADMEISMKQMMLVREDLYKILAHHTGQPFDVIEKNSDRDYWMRASQAQKYGLIDKVLTHKVTSPS